MATLITSAFGSASCPQVQLEVTQSSSTATTATLSWTLKWITHGYTVNSSLSKSYTVKIDNNTVKTGSFAIGGKTTQTIASGSVTINKGTASRSIPIYFSFVMDFTWSGTYCGTKTASGSITVGAKTSYKVTYNANGGSGVPSQQTKWHGTNLTLSSTKPTRSGYIFKGWATSASGSVAYASGATYSANASVTLYAVWQNNTYKVTYNANGGSGAPSQQTKTQNVVLKLSTTVPTRTNYIFKGWATSASGSVAYKAGDNYVANAPITLYAVWQSAYVPPTISKVNVQRCNSYGTVSEKGTCCKLSFSWSCSQTTGSNPVKTITASWSSGQNQLGNMSVDTLVLSNKNSGTVSEVINGSFGMDSSFTFTITITDNKNGSTKATKILPTAKFLMDFKNGGSGVAFGKVAELNDTMDIGYKTKFTGGITQLVISNGTDLDTILTPNVYTGNNAKDANYKNVPFTSGTFTLRVESSGPSEQLIQTITLCDKNLSRIWERAYYSSAWGEWKCTFSMSGTVLWTGGWYMLASQTANLSENISEQPNGIVLVFSEYVDGATKDASFHSYFVPKKLVSLMPGKGHMFDMKTLTLNSFATKYLYISDNKIVGHDNNKLSGTGSSGIKYANNNFVMRYVIGV